MSMPVPQASALLYEAAVFAVPCLGPLEENMASKLVQDIILHPTYLSQWIMPEPYTPESLREMLIGRLVGLLSSKQGGQVSFGVSSRNASSLSSLYLTPSALTLPQLPDWMFQALSTKRFTPSTIDLVDSVLSVEAPEVIVAVIVFLDKIQEY